MAPLMNRTGKGLRNCTKKYGLDGQDGYRWQKKNALEAWTAGNDSRFLGTITFAVQAD